ncbi:MAG: hypothetical protein KBD78_03905 [Oligoflexales bacterium]|nr:hypothetical protein [Oligoflexales bacterium]
MGLERNAGPTAFSTFRGLNTKLSEISITSREASDLQNVLLQRETIDVRYGCDIFTTTQMIEGGAAKPGTGLFQAVLSGSTYQVVTSGTKIYSMTGAGVLADITGAVTLTDSQNLLFSFSKFKNSSGNDIIIAANGLDAPIKWTGSGNAATLAGSPPANFKYILVRKNRLYGSDGEFVYHSALLNGESWDALNWVARFSSQGIYTNEVTGLAKYGDNLVIFKEDAIFMFSGENFTDGYIDEVVTGDGCISGHSIVEVASRRFGNILVFVNRNGELKGFNGTKNLINISEHIDNTLQTYNQSRFKYSCGVNYKKYNHYLSSYTSAGTTSNKLIAHDYFLDGYSGEGDRESTMLLHSGIAANYLRMMDSGGVESLFSTTYDGWVLKHGTNTKDIHSGSQIAASPTGAVRTSNVVTITTSLAHGFLVGDSITVSVTTIASGSGSFDGTFTVTEVPSSTSFRYNQTAANATGGAGIAKKQQNISAYWTSKKNNFGNAAHQKLLQDLSIVTASSGIGQIKITVTTDSGQGTQTQSITPSGAIYGVAIYGLAIYGGGGARYTRFELDTGAPTSLNGRYFKIKFENIGGFLFSLEEYIMGITDLGYQAEYIAT